LLRRVSGDPQPFPRKTGARCMECTGCACWNASYREPVTPHIHVTVSPTPRHDTVPAYVAVLGLGRDRASCTELSRTRSVVPWSIGISVSRLGMVLADSRAWRVLQEKEQLADATKESPAFQRSRRSETESKAVVREMMGITRACLRVRSAIEASLRRGAMPLRSIRPAVTGRKKKTARGTKIGTKQRVRPS
jgi:hypothetical protein